MTYIELNEAKLRKVDLGCANDNGVRFHDNGCSQTAENNAQVIVVTLFLLLLPLLLRLRLRLRLRLAQAV